MDYMNKLHKNESPEMILAFESAISTFKYFGVNFIGNIDELFLL